MLHVVLNIRLVKVECPVGQPGPAHRFVEVQGVALDRTMQLVRVLQTVSNAIRIHRCTSSDRARFESLASALSTIPHLSSCENELELGMHELFRRGEFARPRMLNIRIVGIDGAVL